MAKIYAVKKGRKTGRFYSWGDCEAQVKGFSGAEFKGCNSEREVDEYLGIVSVQTSASLSPVNVDLSEVKCAGEYTNPYNLGENDCIAYVDGSYKGKVGYYSFGVVLFTSDAKYRLCGCDNADYLVKMNNITGELLGAMKAILKAESLGKTSILIVHDLEGTYEWVKTVGKQWESNRQGTFEYKEFIANHRRNIDIFFKWTKGHSGVEHNEEADELASLAIDKRVLCDSTSVFRDFVSQ